MELSRSSPQQGPRQQLLTVPPTQHSAPGARFSLRQVFGSVSATGERFVDTHSHDDHQQQQDGEDAAQRHCVRTETQSITQQPTEGPDVSPAASYPDPASPAPRKLSPSAGSPRPARDRTRQRTLLCSGMERWGAASRRRRMRRVAMIRASPSAGGSGS